jgi:NAD(P) transhydrogenase subunit beta
MIHSFISQICIILFILSIHLLASPKTAERGNLLGIIAVITAVISTLFLNVNFNLPLIILTLFFGTICGFISGKAVKMTSLPQAVAVLNGLGGLSSVLTAQSEALIKASSMPFILALCLLIGTITFSGSLIAFGKLQGIINFSSPKIKYLSPCLSAALIYTVYCYLNSSGSSVSVIILAFWLGISLTLPVGGADMPIVISLLNSLSGWSIVLVGITLNDLLLIIVGTLIGSSGFLLSAVMTKAMNRSLIKILWPHSAVVVNTSVNSSENIKSATPKEAAFFLENSHKVIIVPGFGMAAAQAQNALKNMADILTDKYGVSLKFAIHPVAGRMPGHMNVLLAEAKIDTAEIFELKDINSEFSSTDVVYIIGANDITNPSARTDTSSPLYGMPVLEVEKAKLILFVKRSLSAGYSGTDNPLFYAPNTFMLFGDAKQITEEIVKEL